VRDARSRFLKDAHAITRELSEAARGGRTAPGAADDERLARTIASLEKALTDAIATQGVALAAVLRVLHERGWVSSAMASALRQDGWLS